MFTPMNPEGERIRAESILRSFTQYEEAVNLFARPESEQNCDAELAVKANKSPFFMRVFKGIKLNSQPTVDESVQQAAYSPRQVATSGCSE